MVWHLKIGPKMRLWEPILYFGDFLSKTKKIKKTLAGGPWNLFWVAQMVPMDLPKGPWGISAIKFFRWSQYQISAQCNAMLKTTLKLAYLKESRTAMLDGQDFTTLAAVTNTSHPRWPGTRQTDPANPKTGTLSPLQTRPPMTSLWLSIQKPQPG